MKCYCLFYETCGNLELHILFFNVRELSGDVCVECLRLVRVQQRSNCQKIALHMVQSPVNFIISKYHAYFFFRLEVLQAWYVEGGRSESVGVMSGRVELLCFWEKNMKV